MTATLVISIFTTICLIGAIVFVPEIRIGKRSYETFWMVAVLGMAMLLIFGKVTFPEILANITASNSINPLKILVLFLSMTVLSVILDELGFFRKLAYLALKKANGKQLRIFLYLYITVSILTIFTSNDIIILTFTPFICYFSKNAKINPLPYLISEFVAANTWSMMLVIGNPTNIYLASAYEIHFLTYFQVMFFPTVISSLVAFGLLLLLFRKELTKQIIITESYEYELKDKPIVGIILAHLIICTILLAVSSYIGLEMWYICLSFCLSALLWLGGYELLKKRQKPLILKASLKKSPWSLVPFILSMFVFVMALNKFGITAIISRDLSALNPVFGFGLSSFLTANIINNIPMTILYSNILETVVPVFQMPAIYASVIGSNIGAYLTPIGALAGIMWMQILKKQGVKLSFPKFIEYGMLISVPTILVALLTLLMEF